MPGSTEPTPTPAHTPSPAPATTGVPAERPSSLAAAVVSSPMTAVDGSIAVAPVAADSVLAVDFGKLSAAGFSGLQSAFSQVKKDPVASVDAAFLAPCVIWRAGSATGSATAHGHDDEPPAKAGRLGVLEDLRTYRPTPEGPRRVRAHATLAWVRYPNARKSLLLLVKPGITEDLPPDLLNYQRANPDFPQQSTLHQFFDEAQWESYRKLGERIAAALFAPASSGAGKWSPHQFCRLPEQPPDAPQAAAGDS